MIHDDPQWAQDTTYWEKVASTRWGTYITEIERIAVLQANALSREHTSGLEIGCESGRWLKLLTDLGWNMMCTEINEETLKICKKRIPTADYILVRPEDKELPCASESLGLVLCLEVAPVIQTDWFIDECLRVLRNDGLIVGVFWNLLSFRGLIMHMHASFTDSFDYYKIAYPIWRKRLFTKGVRMLHEEGCCWFPFHRGSNSVFVPHFILLEKILGLRKLPAISPWVVFIAQKSSREHLI